MPIMMRNKKNKDGRTSHLAAKLYDMEQELTTNCHGERQIQSLGGVSRMEQTASVTVESIMAEDAETRSAALASPAKGKRFGLRTSKILLSVMMISGAGLGVGASGIPVYASSISSYEISGLSGTAAAIQNLDSAAIMKKESQPGPENIAGENGFGSSVSDCPDHSHSTDINRSGNDPFASASSALSNSAALGTGSGSSPARLIPNLDERSEIMELDLSNKGLKSLDLSGYDNLFYLNISGNDLEGVLDVSKAPSLHFLDCSDNKITEIVGFSDPWGLNCSNNAIPYLDISGYEPVCFMDSENKEYMVRNICGYEGKMVENDFSGQKIHLRQAATTIELNRLFEGINPDRITLGSNNGTAKLQDGTVVSDISTKTISYYYQPSALSNTPRLDVTLIFPEVPSDKPIINDPLKPLDPDANPGVDGVSDLQKYSGIAAMQRVYNPNSGEHFYTKDVREYNYLVSIGWKDEGIGWYGPNESAHPVYRLYNRNAGDHHYTLSVRERDELRRLGWTYEGVGWYSDEARQIPLYRQYNPNAKAGAHNYTQSQRENDYLVSVGWKAEGIAWYGIDLARLNDLEMSSRGH